MNSTKGKLIIFAAPSGSGKTTIVHHLLAHDPRLVFSVSACTREKRATEVNGKDYYFLSPDEFKQKITNGEFIEWEEVYKDHFYGTLHSEVARLRKEGKTVLFDVDVAGALSIKKQFGDDALSVFVKVPSIEILLDRLKKRGTESEESFDKRRQKIVWELTFETEFDKVLVNDDLDTACFNAQRIVDDFLAVD